MKKSLIYLVVFLFLVQLAFAGINIDPFLTDQYNIGDKVNIKGGILFEEDIQGSMKIDLNCGENNTLPVYFTLLDLVAGTSEEYGVTVPMRDSFIGKCNFIVVVNGAAENYQETSGIFEVTDKLNVEVIADKLLANPGDSVKITGSAKKINGDLVEKGSGILIIDGDSELVELKDGVFENYLQLYSSIDSGKHEIEFSIQDDKGNKGEDKTNFKVNAVPTTINLVIDEEYSPGENIIGKVLLYDQAGKPMEGSGSVEFYNPSGDIEFTKNIKSEENFEFKLDQFSIPGTWRANSIIENLEINKNIKIEEIKKIETLLEGSVFSVRNIGNVDYNDPIEITLEGVESEINVVKMTSLKPNQTIQFDLSEEVKYGGEYKVSSPMGITGNVVLEGKGVGSTMIGWIALTLVFLFLIYIVLRRGNTATKVRRDNVRRNKVRQNKIKEVREKGRDVLERTTTKEDVIRQKDIDHLINKVKRENPQLARSRDSSGNQNMFRMFD